MRARKPRKPAAAGQVDEDLGDTGSQFGLFDGGFDGGALEGVEGLAHLTDLVLVVLQARHFGLDVDVFARRQAAHHAGQPDAGGLVGVQAQLAQIADEAAANAHGQEQGDQQGEEAEHTGDDRLGDDAHRDGPDAFLIAVARLVVEFGHFGQHIAGRGVPALRRDTVGCARPVGDGGLLGDAQRGAAGVRPEAVEAVAFPGGKQGEVDVVEEVALGRVIRDLADLHTGEFADDERGAEEGVLAGEEFTGAGEVDQGAVLLVHLHVVDDVEVGEQVVAGVDQTVVEVEGGGAVDGAVVDAAAQRAEAVERVQDSGETLGRALAHGVAHIGVLGVRADLGDGLVGGGAAAGEGGLAVGGTGVGEVDEGLAAFLLEDADRVLDGVADLLHDGRHVEQLLCLAPRQYRGETPDGGQGHQRHEKQRHDLPADGLPAKAHGLPQLGPRRAGVHMCVNKRREPTTDGLVTRRADRNLNFRTGGERWGVVGSLGEIASRISSADRPNKLCSTVAPIGRNFSFVGNLRGVSFVLLIRKRGRNRPQEPRLATGRRKSAQAGQPQGSRVFGHGSERSAGGGE